MNTPVLEQTQASVALADPPTHPSIHQSTTPPPALALQLPTGPLALAQTGASGKKRNGKIAQLPKPEREMVNLMLRDDYPYWRIEDALSHQGFKVSQRNISNWKTRGGYKEWCAAQTQALELRLFQDNLTNLLRRHDAAELPEVGLQSAATNLSAILLRPDLMRELLADPEKYAKLIELQCRLTRELQGRQKYRDEVSNVVGGNPERLKRQQEAAVEETRKLFCASTDPDQGHFVLPENFTHKQLEPLKLFSVAEQEHARVFESFFKPGPDNPMAKPKALPAPAPAPNTHASQKEDLSSVASAKEEPSNPVNSTPAPALPPQSCKLMRDPSP